MKKINADIIADSKNEHGQRITTFVLTYPRFIHAELLTHRLFSRNAASSRAIPASRMIKDIEEDPFIPVAFQADHKGMQGTEYIKETVGVRQAWKESAHEAIKRAKYMSEVTGCTKQLVNRILEPYQWYTCIVTATEYDNFFELRCPQYEYAEGDNFKSIKDAAQHYSDEADKCMNMGLEEMAQELREMSILEKLKINNGAGEIHISLLAEAMWDARNESEPKKLKAGEWHIPFGDKFDNSRLIDISHLEPTGFKTHELEGLKVKIATARCARVSYLNFEGKDDYEADIDLYGRLLVRPYTDLKGNYYGKDDPKHMSPSEHCARAMSGEEMMDYAHLVGPTKREECGWSGNFRGFVQLRKEIE